MPNVGFKVTEPSQIGCKTTAEKLGLPKRQIVMSLLWESAKLDQFGTQKRVFITETGDVHSSMSAYLREERSIGSITERGLDDILNSTEY